MKSTVSTAAKDLKIKRDLYEKHGVKEYWLVHPTDKTIMIYRMIRDNQYGKADIYTGEDIIASQVIEGFEVNLIEIFGPMPPEVFPKQKESAK
ncbi:MAG: Uma2 family endonuclease [Deltaproteobacteria bacterium]|nr:Uma2 family endonuclease [Deltaproteobacteria bacterium]